jgi:hypothetical protein
MVHWTYLSFLAQRTTLCGFMSGLLQAHELLVFSRISWRQTAIFSSGEKPFTDLNLSATSSAHSTEYLPPNLLNAKCEVMVDEDLWVKTTTDIWAVGDIVDI